MAEVCMVVLGCICLRSVIFFFRMAASIKHDKYVHAPQWPARVKIILTEK